MSLLNANGARQKALAEKKRNKDYPVSVQLSVSWGGDGAKNSM